MLAPTRELASQIAESFRTYGAAQGVSVLVVFGGVKYGAQIKGLLGGVDVLVATPGRLIDHMQERHVDLSAVEHFVLDEADQMLDLGFFQPIRKIVARLPGQAPEPVLLGHHAQRDQIPGRRPAHQSSGSLGDAASHHGGPC